MESQDTVLALSGVTKDDHDELKRGWSVSWSIFGLASAEICNVVLIASYCGSNVTVDCDISWGRGGIGDIAALVLNLGKVQRCTGTEGVYRPYGP